MSYRAELPPEPSPGTLRRQKHFFEENDYLKKDLAVVFNDLTVLYDFLHNGVCVRTVFEFHLQLQGHEIYNGILYAWGLLRRFLHLCRTVGAVHFDLISLFHSFSLSYLKLIFIFKHMNKCSYVNYYFTPLCSHVKQQEAFLLLFGQMLEALADDGPDVVVRQEIDHGFSFSSALYQSGLLEDLQLVGYGRLGHA